MSEQLVKRLRELSNAVTRADWNEFSMRIPVEKDRDADFVLLQAADKIAALEADAARLDFLDSIGEAYGFEDTRDDYAVWWDGKFSRCLRSGHLTKGAIRLRVQNRLRTTPSAHL